jgi:hypothetical protein
MRIILLMIVFSLNTVFAQNQNLSNGLLFNGEPYLAQNPNDPQNLVVAWMGFESIGKIAITTRASFDGGESWSPKVKIPHENDIYSSADPTLAFDKNGNVFLVYIDFDAPVETAQSGAILIRKSSDGGVSWGNSVKVTDMNDYPGKKAIDRPWVVIDNSEGEYQGYIYITTMNARGATAPYHPYIHISGDEGSTWNNKHLDTEGVLAGSWIPQPVPSPTVSSDGTFHAVYPSLVYSQYPQPQYFHVSSSDGGNTFDYSTVYIEESPLQDNLAKRAWLLISDDTDAEHLAFLNIISPYGDGDVYLWESFDKGETWNESVRVNDDPMGNGRLQDLVWADFNETGDLFVSWRDRRNAPESGFETSSEIMGAVKFKGNANFEKNFTISDELVPYDTLLGATSGNDFQGVRFSGNYVYSAWGSNQNGFLNIWFAKSEITPTAVKEIFRSEINNEYLVSPNPASEEIRLYGYSGEAEILDTRGEIVWSGYIEHDTAIDIKKLETGVYFLRTKSFLNKFVVGR